MDADRGVGRVSAVWASDQRLTGVAGAAGGGSALARQGVPSERELGVAEFSTLPTPVFCNFRAPDWENTDARYEAAASSPAGGGAAARV